MTRPGDFERTIGYAEQTLSQLRGNRVPANPRNFELWYSYVSGFDRTLNRAIDEAITRYGQVPDSVVQDIYQRFLSPEHMNDRVGAVCGEFLNACERAGVTIDDIEQSIAAYQRTLEVATAKLGAADTTEKLKEIAEALLAATEDAQKRAHTGGASLDAAVQQIGLLHENLEGVRAATLTDALTGVATRARFEQRMRQEMRECDVTGGPFALLIGDIDSFKRFNDSYGRQAGDQVLRLVAHALKSNVKGRDLAARYGDDEFAVILSGAGLDDAVIVGNHIRKSIMAKELVKKSTGESLGVVTMSFGAAVYRPGESAEALIARADMSLYAAKNAGRNRLHTEADVAAVLVNNVA